MPDIGVEGQERLLAAKVTMVGEGVAVDAAMGYLSRAGVRHIDLIREGNWPVDGTYWLALLEGTTIIVRSGLDDDSMLRAAVRLGIPAVVMRGGRPGVDVLSFRHHGPCPHAALDIPARPAEPWPEDGGLAVVAGTLAAAEACWRIACPADGPRARHLKLVGGEPVAQDIPWAPECFLCGGQGREAVPS